ncbi:MAG: putative Mg2+ and Co2+ transporter [Pseudomonadota bacterium]|jgi:Mg2+ and Co2+ transporter CorA
MQIVIFTQGSLQFVDQLPSSPPSDGFVWVFTDRETMQTDLPALQTLAQQVGGSTMLDLHCQDLASAVHPSHYDYTSVYDLIIFRRLATQTEMRAEAEHEAAIEAYHGQGGKPRIKPNNTLPGLSRISSKAVGFAVFDRLLISIHPRDCYSAKSFIQRFLADASSGLDAANARNRIPTNPVDLVLRMVNAMVDSYLDLRKELTVQLDNWQTELLKPHSRFNNWSALTGIRSQLHTLEDLCEEQHDAMQEWLDTLREQPLIADAMSTISSASPVINQSEHDALIARARDVIEHIERVVHHVRRLEQSAESAIQIYFGAQGNRTNDIMRTLTALTAIFLPLNLITGFFGMNFETFPLIHNKNALWWTMGVMVLIAITMGVVFWRKRYLARTGR